MLTSERRRAIAEMVKNESGVTTAGLMKVFNVSFETIRKDLLFLEKNNELMRVHGGAVSKSNLKPYYEFDKRVDENREKKRELSRIAASLVSENDTIGIDAGTTAVEFTEELMRRFHSLTIVTHSMDVFERLNSYKNFNIILCGGNYMKEERMFYGAFVHTMLDNLYMNKSFIFPAAVSLKKGVCDYQSEAVQAQKKLIENSGNAVFLADSSKYEQNALYKMCDVSSRHIYIADSALSESIKALYRENECRIITRKEELDEIAADFVLCAQRKEWL